MHAYLLKNGRVLIGQRKNKGQERTFDCAHLVEKWGTTDGLAQLALGPTAKTQATKVHNVTLPADAFLISVQANPEAWKLPADAFLISVQANPEAWKL